MSQQNVDKVRAFIDAYNRRDFDAAIESFDPEIDFVLPAQQSADSGRGTAHVIRFFEGLDETFDDVQLLPQEFVDCGDCVATRLRHFAHGKRSGLALDQELYHQVTTFSGGKIVRIEYFDDWHAALDAAGLSDH
jgi:ketosteroid isomerase-like protein